MVNVGGPGQPLKLPLGGSVRLISRSSDGRESIPWIVFTNKSHRDVYLAQRTPSNDIKLSLHESGDYRLQTIQRREDGTRLLKQYRPEPAENGWTKAASLVTPSDGLHSVRFDPRPMRAKDAVSYWPPPEAIEVLAFHIVIGTAEALPIGLGNRQHAVAEIELLGGGRAAILAEYSADPGYLKTIREARAGGQMDEWKADGPVLQSSMLHFGHADIPGGYTMPVITDLGPVIDPARAFRRKKPNH